MLIKTRAKMPAPHLEEAAPPAFTRAQMLSSRLRLTRVLPYQQAAPPLISNVALSILSGLLLVFAFPEWNLWSLGWVGAAPLIMAVVRERRFWRSALLGLIAGTVFYIGTSHWITYSIHNYGGVALWLSYMTLPLFGGVLGIFTGLFSGLLGLLVKRFGGWAMLLAPLVWPASEWTRLKVTGMGWNALGYSQAFKPEVIQIAAWGGVYLVSAMLVATSTALVFAVVYLEKRRGFLVLTAVLMAAVSAVVYGQVVRKGDVETGSVVVAAVQPNVPIDGPWGDSRFFEQMVTRHIDLSRQAIETAISFEADRRATPMPDPEAGTEGPGWKGAVDLVIWPEAPTNFEYDRDPGLRRRLAEFTDRIGSSLMFSSWGVDAHSESDAVFNSAMLIGPSGEKTWQYDKIALMPFGEFVPARNWLPLADRIPALVGDVTPGKKSGLADVAGAKLGAMICFEATRPEIARDLSGRGATALVLLSNEAWFGPTAAARQVLAHTVFRAVENNVDVLRVTNSGLSARIDAGGGVHDETAMFEAATRVWRAKATAEADADTTTFYTRHGDAFAVSCGVVSVLLGIVAAVRVGRKEDENA